jgi:AraC-like DNA-binding protein
VNSRFYNPLPVLKDFVKYYIIFDTYIDDFNQLTQCSIPYNCPVLIFTVSDDTPTFIVEGHSISNISGHIGGQTYSPIYMHKPGNFRIIVVLFQANGAYHLFRIPQNEYLDQFVTLQNLLGKKSNDIQQRIYDNRNNNHEIIRELNIFLLRFLKNNEIRKTYLDDVISQIIEKNGNIKVEELCTDLNINPRTLRRYFKEQVGVTPKEFGWFFRLNVLHKYLMYYPNISIHDLVYQLGYFDQSHLINDFKKYAHYSPGLLSNNIILSHFMKADSYYEKFPA